MKSQPDPKQIAFRVAGAASSIASFWGTHGYLMHETQDIVLATTGAGILGGLIYAGLDVAFNHKKWLPRIAAGSIALTLAGLSVFTIYQTIKLPEEQARQAEATAAKEQAQRHHQTKTVAAKNKAAADREANQATQQNLTASIVELQAANTADRSSIKERQTQIDNGIRPKGNGNEIHQFRKDIRRREAEIKGIQNQILKLAAEFKTIEAKIPASAQAPAPSTTAHEIEYDTLARAALYDLATILFLLFGSFYRRQREENQSEEISTLQQALKTAQAQIRNASGINADTATLLTEAKTIIEQLKQQQVSALEAKDTATSQLIKLMLATGELLQTVEQEGEGIKRMLNTSTQHQQKFPEILQAAGTETENLQSAITTADQQKSDLQDAITTANKVIADANRLIAPAIKPVINLQSENSPPSPSKLNDADVFELLRNQSIPESGKGFLPVDLIQTHTGFGRIKAKKLLENAAKKGILASGPNGNGTVYFYPRTREEESTNNVISMTGARS